MMDVIEQEFLVPVRYPVHFTTGVFAASNPLLRDLVAMRPAARTHATTGAAEDDAPAKLVVVIDRGVERAHPALIDAIGAYCAAHGNAIALSAPILVVPFAIRAGLRPLAAGFTVAIAGQGMALSSDYVIRVAPGLSAKAASADPTVVAAKRAFGKQKRERQRPRTGGFG